MELIIKTCEDIALKMLNVIIYSNDMVNREEALNEAAYDHWKKIVAATLEKPILELGLAYFTDEWIEMFCDGDSDFVNNEVEEYPVLKELNSALSDFFEEYDNYESGSLENFPVYSIDLTKSALEIVTVALNPSDRTTLSKDIVNHCVRNGKKTLPYLDAALELADKMKDIIKQSKHQ